MRRLPQLGLLIVLALLALGAPPAASQGGTRLHLPLVSIPDLFVFVSDRDSGSTIVEAAPDGSARRTLSGPTTNDSAPAISPDGSQIAFFSTRDGHNALYVMARDGSGQRKLADCNICVGVRWAPDSRRLWLDEQLFAYTGFGPPYNEIRTLFLDLDGAPPVLLPSACAALSRDGVRCAYLESREGGWNIAVRSSPTADPIIVASSIPLPMFLSWSPDGATLVYGNESFSDGEIYVVGLDGAPPRWIATGRRPLWSPAGDLIAFLAQPRPAASATLKVVSPDGDEAATIATGVYELFGWSPDGAQLAYVDGTEARRLLLANRGGGQPLLMPSLTNVVMAMAWSPDSGRLAVTAYHGWDPSIGQISSVYTLRRDGSGLREIGPGSGPLWAPDGASLLMTDYHYEPPRLYAQAVGAAATPIAYGELPALAPGGRRLAFVRGGELFTIDTDGQGERGLAEMLTVVARPAWSPDARRIAVAAHAGGPEGIYLVDVEASTPRLLTGCGGTACGAPSWAPDGATIYFGQKEIVSVAAEGGEPETLGQATAFALAPDGASIAYVSGDIFVMGADGAGARKLTECVGAFTPGSAWCGNLAWSADGRSLSFGRSGIIGGKASFSETQVVDAVSGAELLRQPWYSARWRGQELAYLYAVTFGHYTSGYYDLSSSYTKLHMPSFGSCCGPIPPGHGNVLDYALVP